MKVPEEPKPFYVDFDSAPFVEGFSRICRKASAATVSEMLPSPGETWLADAAGSTYTSELRVVARDGKAFPSPMTDRAPRRTLFNTEEISP